jgi:peptide methionine sulfoxide reductase MsrA
VTFWLAMHFFSNLLCFRTHFLFTVFFVSKEPTYNQVCAGMTGHTEAVLVYYNPKECTYEQLLDTFFSRVNPTTGM